MLKRLILVLIALLIIAPLQAQSQTIDPCFGLSADDCALIGSASTNTLTGLSAFQADFVLDVSLNGLETVGLGNDFALNVIGNGAFSRENAASDLPFAVDLNLDATLTGRDDSAQVQQFHLLLVDETLFSENIATGAWQGVKLEDVLASPQFAALNGLDAASSSLAGFNNLLTIPGFIRYERLAATDQNLSPFSFQLDFMPLFQSSEFQRTLDQGLQIVGQMGSDFQNLALIAPLLLQNTDLKMNLTQFVEPELNFVQHLTLDLNGMVDLNPLMGTSGNNALPPITLSFHFEIELSAVNEAQVITAPATFSLITPQELGLP